MCVLIFSTTFIWNLSAARSAKLQNLYFLVEISENTQIPNLMKILPVGAELLHADGRTDGQTDRHDEAISHFFKLCERF